MLHNFPMGAPKGSKNALGNKGNTTNHPSHADIKDQSLWHLEKWEQDSMVLELLAKVKSGKYSVRDMFLLKALQGNEKILNTFANKLLPDLHDLRGKDGERLRLEGFIYQPPEKPAELPSG